MQKHFAKRTAAIVGLSRNILTNTAAGLITAALLGFWSPALKKAGPPAPSAVSQSAGKVNIDPASGKILDRVDIAEEETVAPPRLKPLLLGYALPALTNPTEAETAPQKARKPRETVVARAASAQKAQRPSVTEPESRNMATETPAADSAPPAQNAAAEGWMAKIAPGALTARLAPISGYVSGGVAAAKRAVADRLEAIGL